MCSENQPECLTNIDQAYDTLLEHPIVSPKDKLKIRVDRLQAVEPSESVDRVIELPGQRHME